MYVYMYTRMYTYVPVVSPCEQTREHPPLEKLGGPAAKEGTQPLNGEAEVQGT